MSSRRRVRRHQKTLWPVLKRYMQWLFRLLSQLQRRRSQAGFVFPATLLLLLVVTLTAGALTYRAYSRSGQVILERQQQIIQNAATPAIDRAKAKLEYLFSGDDRSRPRVPPSKALENLLRADGNNMLDSDPYLRLNIESSEDVYTLQDESRLNLDKDDKLDNAWIFPADIDDDGVEDEYIVYSITLEDLKENQSGEVISYTSEDQKKAEALVVRNSSLTAQASTSCTPGAGAIPDAVSPTQESLSGAGWEKVTGVSAEKSFQVNVLAIDPEQTQNTEAVSTLEFQQIREADLANKWGAFFRYDLEVYPGVDFNWNGAMHTQGSLFAADRFNAYMISSTESCVYDDEASEITLGATNANGFTGQLVAGSNKTTKAESDGYNGGSTIQVDDGDDKPDIRKLGQDDGTITAGQVPIQDIYLDPIQLHLRGEYQHIGNINGDASQLDKFEASARRIRNIDDGEVRISLDDVYRADDRYGPPAVYDESNTSARIPDASNIGEPILNNGTLTNAVGGLDGYWERQAANEGSRFIVGQRLELGNVSGWNFDPTSGSGVGAAEDRLDPLYPPTNLPVSDPGSGSPGRGESAQRKSLRDNLAAVQGMVAYHYRDGNGGLDPQVCIATTAHFANYEAIANSRTFRERTDNPNLVMADFLTGNGTNGWQFDVVSPTDGDMENALTNLVRFAGDPSAGAPSFTPVQDGFIHPYPYMAMWGDFAIARRIVDPAAGSGTFTPTSMADQSALDTAACTMSLLAYNLESLLAEYTALTAADWQALAQDLVAAYGADQTLRNEVYPAWQARPEVAAAEERFLEAGARYWEVEYSRTYGFNNQHGFPNAPTTIAGSVGTYDPDAGAYDLNGNDIGDFLSADGPFNVSCDPNLFSNATYGINNEEQALALALAMCPHPNDADNPPRFPALFYLFPAFAHDYESLTGPLPANYTYGDVNFSLGTLNATFFDQPATEPYVEFVSGNASPDQYNQNEAFAAFEYWTGTATAGIASIAAEPYGKTGTNWIIRSSGGAAISATFDTDWGDPDTPDDHPWDLVITNDDGTFGSAIAAPILDKVIYSGRENMAIRLLDMNVEDLLAAPFSGDTWISGEDEARGIVYAFREDAVREDSIVRPRNTNTFSQCDDYNSEFYGTGGQNRVNQNCSMVTDSGNVMEWLDPPLEGPAVNGDFMISLKIVDFTPDPLRKPYGFRLRNGSDLGRTDSAGEPIEYGMTFISDSAVAIQGDFNRHSPGTAVTLEEFTETVFDKDPANGDEPTSVFYTTFYGREADEVDEEFASVTDDTWRPTEILGDAIYLFSDALVDGYAEAAYDFTGPNAPPRGSISFHNMNRLDAAILDVADVLRETPGDLTSPIYFDRNGRVYEDGTIADLGDPAEIGYLLFSANNLVGERNDNLSEAEDTQINALLISGIVPSRFSQAYGGLHNFPRLNEAWTKDRDLQIAGGFFQLFFSNSSTGPYEMEAWEPDQEPLEEERFAYYLPPNRIWGYDVALQYAQTPPIAERFVAVRKPRSEFYRELPIDDPYIKMLRCATNPIGNGQVDPAATNCPF